MSSNYRSLSKQTIIWYTGTHMTQETALHIMKTGKNVFLTGAPGSGKTYTLNAYLDYLKKHGIDVAITAPTGIAASHIGGTTLHSFFGIGIKESLSQYDIENLTEKKYIWDRLKNLKVLVIDEVSMLSPALFESIDAVLKTFKFSHEAFGGIQVILVGDFFQLPPISKNTERKKFIFQTDVWDDLNLATCYLETAHRHHHDTLFLDILNEIRNGSVSENTMNHFRARYKKDPENVSQITKLYTHNMDVDAINIQELEKINSPLKKYLAHTTGPKKWVERIFESSLVIPNLSLKKGALVFFIKNNYEKGYINGTLGTVIDFDVFDIPIIETRDGKHIKAERMEWNHTDHDGKILGTVKQIPLRLAWAITIHKSQGMTLDAAEIDLSRAFEPGQGYVALSRITSITGLKLMGLNETALHIDPHVLETDCSMREHSREIYTSFNAMNDDQKQEQIAHYMKYLGGSIAKGTQKKQEEQDELEKAFLPKTKSFLESKKFFEQKMSIANIANERELTEMTIMNHLADIINDDPEFDISYLQPDSHIIESVENAVNNINKRKKPEDFLENGDIKLKSIFTELGEKVDYDDIKLALLFLE